jgi:hypothetical protein
MKTFYTDHDIEDMAKAGTREIAVDDDVVLTDLAREKALSLGIKLRKKTSAEPVVAGGRPTIRDLAGAATGCAPSSSPAPLRRLPDPPPKPLKAEPATAPAIPAPQFTAASRKPPAAPPVSAPPASPADTSLSEDEFKRRVKSALMGRLGPEVSEAMIDAAIVKVLKEEGSPRTNHLK